jgi:hypothetical protein
VVDIAEDASSFVAACRRVLGHDLVARDRELRPLLAEYH